MIEFVNGNILEADVEALVNPVNCEGVMGKGLALAFKKAYPANFEAYKKACEEKTVRIGRMCIFNVDELSRIGYIINFPTKDRWKYPSRYSYIVAGLASLVKDARRLGITSIAIPRLGCGCGGLEWDDVKPQIVKNFEELPDVRTLIYEAH